MFKNKKKLFEGRILPAWGKKANTIKLRFFNRWGEVLPSSCKELENEKSQGEKSLKGENNEM